MSADKFAKLQTDVRNNQEDLQSFLRDLNSWESNIKRRDEELRTGDSTEGEKTLPPIRNKKEEAKRTRKKKKKQDDVHTFQRSTENHASNAPSQETEQGKKIRAYDYRSWDKFDVDAACAALDGDDIRNGERAKEEEEEEEYETDSDAEREEMEVQRRVMEANSEKEKGNNLFKKGDYEAAILCYTKGIGADPNNALLSANRAMALLKLKRFEEAEQDCSEAISLDCTYVKAYARRGTARLELGRLEEAKKDFQQVLNIETENKQAKNEIRKIERVLREREEERRRALEPSNIVHPVDKPPHLRSKRPLKRMTIQEVGKGVAEEKQRERERMMAERTRIEEKIKGGAQAGNSVSGAATSTRVEIQEVKSRTDVSTSESRENNGKKNIQGENPTTNSKGVPLQGKGRPLTSSSGKPSMPGIPSSSVQLQADLKMLKGHPESLFQYFKKIPPASYPKLFQNSLDSTMLTQVLCLLKESYITSGTPIFETLQKLSTVKRFDMNIMFMSSKEKQVVRELFDHLKTEAVDEQTSCRLAKKYGL